MRATDEEAAAQKVKDELTSPWAYAGRWEIKEREVEVVESEAEMSSVQLHAQTEGGPMLLKLKDAATELGISYGTLHALIKDGGIEFTQVGASKYISRVSLAAFIEANTHR
ncbi:helix-turn-helix domain-containing protein [Microbacterium sp. CFBP9034]|uniref:helix-turn-helix domain-containing protein n=1 Tax=Microbacterium sp. CFBP9034 TaxID=3096540 RepID=UPI002A69B7FA|nr:helix-turn-helix domain-containing protein [Microbacterium sp. CFBP9034]MDY0909516.1 helix-turn-helix domain-containing protein [Microbacterium sp. CFBP9034]